MADEDNIKETFNKFKQVESTSTQIRDSVVLQSTDRSASLSSFFGKTDMETQSLRGDDGISGSRYAYIFASKKLKNGLSSIQDSNVVDVISTVGGTGTHTAYIHYGVAAGGTGITSGKQADSLDASRLQRFYEFIDGVSDSPSSIKAGQTVEVEMRGPNHGVVKKFVEQTSTTYVPRPVPGSGGPRDGAKKLGGGETGKKETSGPPAEELVQYVQDNPDIKSKLLLIVGDSIASGMAIAGANQQLNRDSECMDKPSYGKCVTQTAKSGETTDEIVARLTKYFQGAGLEPLPAGADGSRIMIVSAGTNDALAQAAFGRKSLAKTSNPYKSPAKERKRNLKYTIQAAKDNIDKIVALAHRYGFNARFMKINQIYTGSREWDCESHFKSKPEKAALCNDWDNENKLRWYNDFISQLNGHLAHYKTFEYTGGSNVEMYDAIHPTTKGSGQLLAIALKS